MSIRTDFSDGFAEQTFGVITGTFAMSQLPNVPGYLARFKAYSANVSPIYLGNMRNSGSFPFPWPLYIENDTGWFSMVLDDTTDAQGNLNTFWQNAASGSCYFSYWVQR